MASKKDHIPALPQEPLSPAPAGIVLFYLGDRLDTKLLRKEPVFRPALVVSATENGLNLAVFLDPLDVHVSKETGGSAVDLKDLSKDDAARLDPRSPLFAGSLETKEERDAIYIRRTDVRKGDQVGCWRSR